MCLIKNGIRIIMEHLQFPQSTMCNIKLWIIGELRQYYSIIQMELGEGNHHNTLKFFMNTILCHIFTKLFQICTDHSVLGKCFQVRNTSKWNYYRECGQAGNSWACSQGVPFASYRARLVEKSFPELDPKILFLCIAGFP